MATAAGLMCGMGVDHRSYLVCADQAGGDVEEDSSTRC
jgi:hypothetical protein